MKLGTMLDASVDRAPDNEALVYQDQRYTYAQLREKALKAATVLQNNGVGEGDSIGIMTFNTPGFVFTALGAWYIGATVVPVNHKFQAPEVEYTINHSGAVLGIVSAELAQIAREGAPHVKWLETESDAADSFDAQLGIAPQATPGDFDDETVAQILYTSGTTSAPKGCVHTHRNITQVATLTSLNFTYDHDDRFLIAMPIWHSAPLNICLMPMLFSGGTAVLQREYHPIETMKLIGEERITSFFGPTIAYAAPIHTARKLGIDFTAFDFSSMKRWGFGGSPIDKTTVELLMESYRTDRFFNQYGMTEMGPTGMFLRPEEQLSKAGSIGRQPMVGNRMRVVKADGSIAEPGEVGEIWFSGDCRMRGYLNNPSATAEAFVGDWYRTGDIARIDDDGYLYIVDRNKDVIIVGGENVYSLEVEEALFTHPKVIDAAVVARKDSEWGEQVVAVVTLAEGEDLTLDQLRDFLSEKLARYKVPRDLIVVDELPRNPSGKILKHQLRDEVSSMTSSAVTG